MLMILVHTVDKVRKETKDLKYAIKVAIAALPNDSIVARLIKKEAVLCLDYLKIYMMRRK